MPIEKNDDTQDQDAGVRLDYKGHVTTNKGGIERQIDSIDEIMNKHCKNRIDVMLPSRASVYYLPAGSSDDDDFLCEKNERIKGHDDKICEGW